MRQALYRKYRSRSFDEVVGQDHIIQTLKNTLAAGRIGHAYLFTGPRGVGKTSVARILAHEVNSLPYTPESVHLDIIEIDAASNRRIDEIRDLREKIHIMPTSAKYKVYIIDEAHMLTREAFNALLKTLEEPPAHCIFILATTEQHKLPETIISRVQRFGFRSVGRRELSEHLQSIADQENIRIKPEALDLLAEHGEGSFRDSIGMLDQLAGYKSVIDEQIVREVLGLPSKQLLKELLDSFKSGDGRGIVNLLAAARDQAINPSAIASGLSASLRHELTEGTSRPGAAKLLRALGSVSSSTHAYDELEISLLEHSMPKTQSAPPTTTPSVPVESNETAPTAFRRAEARSEPGSFSLSNWPDVVKGVKEEAASLYTALRIASPEIHGDTLSLKFHFPLHKKKIDNAKAKDLIGRLIEQGFGARMKIECSVDKNARAADRAASPSRQNEKLDEVQTISNIFGGGELLESQTDV